MKMSGKKIAAAFCAGLIAFSALAVMPSTALAARGGARISAPRVSAPAARPRPSAPAAAKPSSPNQRDYKPSQNASSIKDQAPAARTGSSAATGSSTRWGGMMRNIGLLAGGMMLGGLLSHLFGFGMGGFMSDILGLLMNVVIFAGIFMLIRMAIRKFTGRQREDQDPYHSSYMASSRRDEPINVTPRAEDSIEDIRPPRGQGTDYDPKRMADRYRSK